MKCPKCGSNNINDISFDFLDFCEDCGFDWEASK